MVPDMVTPSILAGIKEEALRSLENLPIPGAPDEAWRRVPGEVVKDLMGFVALEKGFVPGESELVHTGPGRLTRLRSAGSNHDGTNRAGNGATTVGEEDTLLRWTDLELRRKKLRLSRANDVEENLLSAFHLARTEDLYHLKFDTGEFKTGADEPRRSEIEIVLNRAGKATEGELFLPFLIVEAGPGAEAHLQVRLKHPDPGKVRVLLQVVFLLEVDSHVQYNYLEGGEPGDRRNSFFTFEKAYQEEGSSLHLGHTHRSAGTSMSDGRYALMGRGARFETYTLLQPGESGFAGQKISVEHYAPSTSSNVETRSVVDLSARSVFTGAIKIPGGAVGSEGYEQHRSLLLSPTARVQSLPELDIVENEVSCSHGSTVMQPDEGEMFYLTSRGITGEAARGLLTDAFIRQVQSKMPGYQREVHEDE